MNYKIIDRYGNVLGIYESAYFAEMVCIQMNVQNPGLCAHVEFAESNNEES